jgi:hypothetical protein
MKKATAGEEGRYTKGRNLTGLNLTTRQVIKRNVFLGPIVCM